MHLSFVVVVLPWIRCVGTIFSADNLVEKKLIKQAKSKSRSGEQQFTKTATAVLLFFKTKLFSFFTSLVNFDVLCVVFYCFSVQFSRFQSSLLQQMRRITKLENTVGSTVTKILTLILMEEPKTPRG